MYKYKIIVYRLGKLIVLKFPRKQKHLPVNNKLVLTFFSAWEIKKCIRN